MSVIEEAKKLIAGFRSKHVTDLEKIPAMSEKLREVCGKIERTWSGSFAGWHGKMYFRNFQIPSIYERFSGEWGSINGIPDGWEEKQPEEVSAKIEELVGDDFSVKKFEDSIKKFREESEVLKNEIAISFSSFNFDADMAKEKDIFTQIESFEFGKTKGEYINDRLPKTMMSRDTEALRQGTCIASWLYYEGVALEAKSVCEAINNFLSLSDRLMRQIEIRVKSGTSTASAKVNHLANLHSDIYSKCRELYEKGAYAEAVEKSFKVVRDKLRKLTGHETGSEAFGKGKLHIKGAAAQNVDQDFNEAVKFLTMAIDRFRNEKSHTSDAKIDDPVRAYEYLRLSSLAMNLLEDTEILS
ncbi:MAG: TIGR02391 family protein [Actinomycetia bacterium]|nr:TIGR02391 family protein [Actinomycetota bacterium]MCG2790186.1 TIGR02391 family protein [Actinomycetes bacterium]